MMHDANEDGVNKVRTECTYIRKLCCTEKVVDVVI